MKRVLIYALIALLIASCLPRDMQMPQSPLLSTLERKSGLIAYIGADGNVYVSDQGGGNLTQLTQDALIPETPGEPLLYYQNPTWSRDSSQVAFVGLRADGQEVETKVMVAGAEAESLEEIYTSQSEHPVYLNWAPDQETITFISTNVSGQTMLLKNVPVQGGKPAILDTGSPYYWSWAPDGGVMIVHAGGAAASVPDHMSFLDVESPLVEEYALSATPGSFQAPAWSPDGSRIALARVSEEQNEIIVTDAAGETPQTVGTFNVKTAFAWSSDSTRLAYINGEHALDAGTIGALHVVDLETSEEIVEDENVIAFFWSPGSDEIAYFVLLQAEGSEESGDASQGTTQYVLQLHVLDVTNGESRELFTYRPTRQFLSILPYFDQYHQSATIWSPDNNNLVLSFLNSEGNPGIAIVAASGNLEPRLLAQGYLAFWSWE